MTNCASSDGIPALEPHNKETVYIFTLQVVHFYTKFFLNN